MLGKQKVRNLGKVYEYLQDADLRIKEVGRQRITIRDVIFSGEAFNDQWGYYDFVDCEFAGQYKIRLGWLVNCTFTNCTFKDYVIFGNAKNVRFINCTVTTKGLGGVNFSSSTGLVFEACKFSNSNFDRDNVGSVLSEGEISFLGCRVKGFVLGGYKKLTLRNCITDNGELNTASPGEYDDESQMPYSDFLLEDCDFTRGVEMENAELNSFTMRNCKLSVFEPFYPVIRDFALIEGIREGNIDLSSCSVHGKLTVRNCSFLKPHDGHNFWCPGIRAKYTLIENVVCGSHPVNIMGLPIKMTEEKRLPMTLNKSFIIRDCDIPHLHVDWAQTEYLRIENCTIDTLLIRNGRIGKLEIIGCRLKKLDVSNTQVQEQDVRVQEGGKISGLITVTTGSNIKLLPRK